MFVGKPTCRSAVEKVGVGRAEVCCFPGSGRRRRSLQAPPHSPSSGHPPEFSRKKFEASLGELYVKPATLLYPYENYFLLTPALVAIHRASLWPGAPVTAQAQTSTNTPASASAPTKGTKTIKPLRCGCPVSRDRSRRLPPVPSPWQTKTKTLTLTITPNTTYLVDKKPATAADFAVGDKVTGSYSKDATGAMMANSIRRSQCPRDATAPATPAAK